MSGLLTLGDYLHAQPVDAEPIRDFHARRHHSPLFHWFYEHPAVGWAIMGVVFFAALVLFFLAVRSVAQTSQLSSLEVVLWVFVLLSFPIFASLAWLLFISKRYTDKPGCCST